MYIHAHSTRRQLVGQLSPKVLGKVMILSRACWMPDSIKLLSPKPYPSWGSAILPPSPVSTPLPSQICLSVTQLSVLHISFVGQTPFHSSFSSRASSYFLCFLKSSLQGWKGRRVAWHTNYRMERNADSRNFLRTTLLSCENCTGCWFSFHWFKNPLDIHL